MTRDEAVTYIHQLHVDCSVDNWDSYGAAPLTKVATEAGLALLGVLPPPSFIAPRNDGGVSLSWGEEDVILHVGPDGFADSLGLWAHPPERLIAVVAKLGAGLTPFRASDT